MKSSSWYAAALLPALALAVTLPFQAALSQKSGAYALLVRLASTEPGNVQVYYDTGGGFNESFSTREPLQQSAEPVTYRLALPYGSFRAFRFDPIDRDGTVTLFSAEVIDDFGRVVQSLPLSEFKPINDIRDARLTSYGLKIDVIPGRIDPQTYIRFHPALNLSPRRGAFAQHWLRDSAIALVFLVLIAVIASCSCSVQQAAHATLRWLAGGPPFRGIAAIAGVAVVVNCLPTVFLHRSFVSPNYGTLLTYDRFPTLPGYADPHVSEVKGSDVGAIMWQDIPYAAVTARSLAHGEWPFWNRDNSLGAPLLGQGQSMFGDPLNFLTMATNSAAWAWDLRYLISKWLLACGLALSVWSLARHRGAALLTALGAPFMGFFIYRINHPAFFSFCYAPWILYAWLRVSEAPSTRSAAFRTVGLMAANWCELNSGTIKEAYTLILLMNFAGAVALLGTGAPARCRARLLAFASIGCALFAGISSPIWGVFFQTLAHAWTTSAPRIAAQIQPGLFLGAFDEALYRPLSKGNLVFNPSSNFLFLGGFLYLLATMREQADRRIFLLTAVAGLAGAFAFGAVPPHWITDWPFVGNIFHIDNCFSLGMILLSAILAGVGLAVAARRLATPAGSGDFCAAGVLLALLAATYVGFTQASHRSVFGPGVTFSIYPLGQTLEVPDFVWGYLASLIGALALLGLLARHALRSRRMTVALVAGFGLCAWGLLWRQAQLEGPAAWPDFVFRPGVRATFTARSDGANWLQRATKTAPYRTIGFQNNLFPGWMDMYGIEGPNGPDALINPYYRDFMDQVPMGSADWRFYLDWTRLPANRRDLDFLNVRYYVDLGTNPVKSAAGLAPVEHADLTVYESSSAWPRAFFTNALGICDSGGDLQDRIVHGDGRPFAVAARDEITSDPDLSALATAAGTNAPIEGEHYRVSPDTTSFTVRAPDRGIVVLTEMYWDGYPHAEVDGRPVRARRVDGIYIGLPVPPGLHHIVVRYRPPYWYRWCAVSGLSLIAAAIAFAWAFRRRQSIEQSNAPTLAVEFA